MPHRSGWMAAALAALCLPGLAGCAPRVVPAGPPVAAPALAEDAILAADGARLRLHHRAPPEGMPVRAVLLALHGFNDHAGNLLIDGFGRLAEAGVLTYAYDQRGFGASPGRTLWPGAATMAEDAALALRLLRARHPGLPLYLMGESMGAAVAVLAAAGPAADSPPDGLLLMAPAFWSYAAIGPVAEGAFWLLAHSLPALAFPPSAGNISASDNTEALRRFGRDLLTIKDTRIDAAWGLLALMDTASTRLAGCCAPPTLVLQGARDRVVPPSVTRGVLRGMRPETRLARYPEGWHLLLRDGIRDTVAQDILAWMENPSAPLPSGADAAGAAWLAQPE
ncbi:alpha/beta fold hydrolase [Teichococcus aestuarii]|uniref:Alpha/beta hydrolase n=1 Tax=Teichococcus aestuarii TaxID=568898 RepID=A0A2U1V8J7_9PROT|nr:alpha/beta fold hydrolase [Pseudoroseomonas aestuarii]PWC30232.1 alpha/beta hydrolase [Pseudoroseomonas aestuarii]